MQKQNFDSVFDAICDTRTEATNMRLRADLMMNISHMIKENHWTQQQAAQHCGITQPRVNDLMNGKIEKFSLDALVNINAELGQFVTLHFQTACS
ncbi:helix-turn-helix domain-containing protein [Acinetobacter puyangensis]|uniref:helix-turn-helix domain-containing protein n=1 Tax=Acinetobacter puyangensis TaxID=1096779 RepID=UPI003A4E421A